MWRGLSWGLEVGVQGRREEGLANHGPAYGMGICRCTCRRCIPLKMDCGGSVNGGCDLEFVTYAFAQDWYAGFGVRFNARTRRFE